MAQDTLQLAVFVSGGGSNLQSLIDACARPDYPAEICVVLSNNPNAYGLERARKAGIETVAINHKNYDRREDFEQAINDALAGRPIDLICLAGFIRILSSSFVEKWSGKIINTHPSLLPKHGGEGMHGMHVHKAVLQAGDRESGSTIHYVIPAVDKGDIILQKRVPVSPDDTAETLAARVLEQEHIAYPEAIRIIAQQKKPT